MIDLLRYGAAPVAQRIEHWPPEPGARVRVPSGAFIAKGGDSHGYYWEGTGR